MRLMLCGQDDDDCNRLCSARRSELAPCDGSAGFDDRELFELGTPVAPVPVHPPGGALRPGIGHRPGVEPLLLPQRRRRDRPRRGPRLAGRRPRAAGAQPCHAGETVPAGPGRYPVVVSEAHEQAIISGHDREEFRRLTLSSWNSTAGLLRSPPGPHPSASPGSEHIFPSGRSPARWPGFSPGGQSDRRPSCRRKLTSNARKIANKKSQAPMEGRRLAHARHRLGHSLAGNPNAGWRPGRQLCLFSGRL